MIEATVNGTKCQASLTTEQSQGFGDYMKTIATVKIRDEWVWLNTFQVEIGGQLVNGWRHRILDDYLAIRLERPEEAAYKLAHQKYLAEQRERQKAFVAAHTNEQVFCVNGEMMTLAEADKVMYQHRLFLPAMSLAEKIAYSIVGLAVVGFIICLIGMLTNWS